MAILANFDKQRGSPLRTPIQDLLSCIGFDIGGIPTYPDQQQLSRYIELEVTSYLKTFLSFCFPEADLEDFPRPYEGIAGKWAHILRDFIHDLESDLINLSKEDRARFQINISGKHVDAKNPYLKRWVASKVKDCEFFFQQGKQNLLSHPSLRYKVGVAILCTKYEYYLLLIKDNNYHLQVKYPFYWGQFIFSSIKLFRYLGIILLSHLRRPHRHAIAASY